MAANKTLYSAHFSVKILGENKCWTMITPADKCSE